MHATIDVQRQLFIENGSLRMSNGPISENSGISVVDSKEDK